MLGRKPLRNLLDEPRWREHRRYETWDLLQNTAFDRGDANTGAGDFGRCFQNEGIVSLLLQDVVSSNHIIGRC